MSEKQTIIELRIQNVKRIQAVELHPNGQPVVIIGGNNAQGKSTILDSIAYLLQGKKAMPDDVVRHGAIRGDMFLKTQDWEIDRRVTADGKVSLALKHKDESVKASPQKLLDDLIGSGIAFDPESFAKLDKKKQADTLRQLVGLDLSELDKKYTCAFEQRTDVNRELKKAEANLSQMTPHGGIPKVETPIAEIVKELTEVRTANGQRAILAQQVAAKNDRRAQLQAQIDQLHVELDALNNQVQGDQLRLEQMPVIDESALLERMTTCEATNRKVRENQAYAAAEAAVMALKGQADALSDVLKALVNDRACQIAACKMPVDGLGFNEAGEVIFNGCVLAECSAAERLKVAVAIGIAMNPDFAVLLIRDGSLLDANSMQVITDMVTAAGAQVLIERVTTDEDGAIIIEDGCVRG